MSILPQLDLHPCLRARVHRVHPPSKSGDEPASTKQPREGFVLYLPTVCLRHEHNPAFAVACRASNHLGVPLVVLAVVVDDASHACSAHPHRHPPVEGSNLSPSVVMTSRRLAFTLQALSHASSLWSAHGAAVGIRIHSKNHPTVTGARAPHHLTLASRALLVVTDEPFVSPYTTFVKKVEGACKRAGVECMRVDGSCTVPPLQVLRKRSFGNEKIKFDGVPGKAYQWQSKTEHLREGHLKAAMEGHFDAPALVVTMEDEDLFVTAGDEASAGESSMAQRLAHLFPSRWKPKATDNAGGIGLPSAPDVRPFTSKELSDLYQNDDCVLEKYNAGEDRQEVQPVQRDSETKRQSKKPLHQFALNWPGADPSVPPCPQTIGTTTHGMARWNNFAQNGGLARYGKERNDARLVHSVSRMSAYLNLGIVSIFRLVWEVKRAQRQAQSKNGTGAKSSGNSRWGKNKNGPDKFEEEIVKWREMSYAHAFSRDDYDDVGSVPRWSVTCLNGHPNSSRYTLEQLANGTTGDPKWDAMQQYLARTGELHNNVRMTWGKSVTEWVGCRLLSDSDDACSSPAHRTLRSLCYLNDRYALDGLSPPSYAGLLWCMGWTDKPSSGDGWTIGKKPAHRYRMTAEDFSGAEQTLLSSGSNQEGGASASGTGSNVKRQRSVLDMMQMQPTAKTSESTAIAATEDMANVSEPKSTDERSTPASTGNKRKGTFTIDSFFSKDSKKVAKGM